MPLISKSDYNPMFLFSNAHFQTIYPPLFRKVKGVNYVRERILTPDRDFIDLDWSKVGADRAVIVSHGLEGHSRRSYVLGMIKAFNTRGWDGIAFNFRGCSGEPNRLIRSYHCGATEDLHTVVSHVIEKKSYSSISLVGFSVGGNLTLMYLGEKRVILLKKRETTLIFFLKCRNQAGMWVLWILNRTLNTGMKRRLRHLQPTIYDVLECLSFRQLKGIKL